MRTDVLLHLSPDNKSFSIYFRILGADFVGKTFDHEFSAKDLMSYLEDWQSWPVVAGDDLKKAEEAEQKFNNR